MSNESPIEKLRRMAHADVVHLTDSELDALSKFDVGKVIRSKPDAAGGWECWIEYRDLKQFGFERDVK